MSSKISPNFSPPKQIETSNRKIPKEYLEIAEGMESQFVDMLFNEMNKSIARENPESSAESYYNSLINYERAQTAAKTGDGIGLKKVSHKGCLPTVY